MSITRLNPIRCIAQPDNEPAGSGTEDEPKENEPRSREYTQAEIDEIVAKRVARVKKQYGDYEDMKKKAAKFDEIEAAMKGMLAPKYQEAIIGHAEVRMTYKVSAVGTIAGCMVKDGKVTRDAQVRILRDNIVIYEGEIGSLQRFKDQAKEVTAGYECGMSILKFNDIKEGDVFECFVMEEVKQ